MNFLLKHRTAVVLAMAIVLPVLMMQLTLGTTAQAQQAAPCPNPDPNTGLCSAPTGVVTSTKGLIDKVNQVINILFTGLLLIAIIFIILAAFSYLTAGGDAEKVKKASHRVLYAAVAVAVAVLARAVPAVVQSFLGSGNA